FSFFYTLTATTAIYTLSLHDALPIFNRVIAAFTTQRNDFGLFDEQLRRWAALPLSDQQRREVERLVEQMRLLRENNEQVLTLAKDRKSTRLNSSHRTISYAVFCLKKK